MYNPNCPFDHEVMVYRKRMENLRGSLLKEYAEINNCSQVVLEIIAIAYADDSILAIEFMTDRWDPDEIAALCEDFEGYLEALQEKGEN